jgi:hypothetical protein
MFPGNMFFSTVISWFGQVVFAGVTWGDILLTAGVIFISINVVSRISASQNSSEDD